MEKFDRNEKMIGISLAVVGLLVAVVQGWLIRFIIPKLGQERSVYVGLGLYALGFMLFAFATQSWMMFAFLIPYCLGGIAGPSLQGIMSTQVSPSEQGELQGALTSLISLTTIVGPILMTELFYYFARPESPIFFPGAPMVMAGVLTIISAFFARSVLKRKMAAAAGV
ncbi:MAG TPA: MFS transporter [Chryseosolibacter sp.]|nr:MFS transporter [Chryseosolibacter sp.]